MDNCENTFLVDWLYQDFEAQLAQEVKDCNIEEKKIQEEENKNKQKANEIKAGILAKPEQVQEAKRILKKQDEKLKKEQRKQFYKKV